MTRNLAKLMVFFVVFFVLFKGTQYFYNAFIPISFMSNMVSLIIIIPILIFSAFLVSSLIVD
ncbi:hypothetical protein [Alkalicoccobacillus plakortidis]|uniref:Uncharacterized protein n=1 Tax=Alkalicoccobacillus plakortidis TaxID=444060 RepID=A0ABT0XNY5_9BACI|nr:hypothetical protein [Alkalicoccobacillus plakortidis]MCM2677612.1 hypothetical protein [Alkalicoccobacillus plakortidis]